MKIKFWGVRGSIPSPGKMPNNFGSNTPCVSLQIDDDIFIFDAGTGIRQLGKYIIEKGNTVTNGHIFLSHYHWDHIHGLPFFEPAFRKRNRFRIYGGPKKGGGLRKVPKKPLWSGFRKTRRYIFPNY